MSGDFLITSQQFG